MRLYLDSSAIVKLVQAEVESAALRAFLGHHGDRPHVTCALARVEVVRAVNEGGAPAVAKARRQLARLDQVALNASLLDSAAGLSPGGQLRSLDAIYLAAAGLLGAELAGVVTYDARIAEAARELGMVVEAPA